MPYMRRAILVQYAVGRPHKGSPDDVTLCGLDAVGQPVYVRGHDDACFFIKKEDAERWLVHCKAMLPDYEHLGDWKVRELPTR